jgi:putative component of toxin-antitoxin plasmid stabilization module
MIHKILLTLAILLTSSPTLNAIDEERFTTAITPANQPLFRSTETDQQSTLVELLATARPVTLIIDTEIAIDAVYQEIFVLHENGHRGFENLTLELDKDFVESNRYRFTTVHVTHRPASPRATSPKRKKEDVETNKITIDRRSPYIKWMSNQNDITAKQATEMITLYTEGLADTRKLEFDGTAVSEIKKRTADNGIRIYYAHYDTFLIILNAGNKSSEHEQINDIKKAKTALFDYFTEILNQIFEPDMALSLKYYNKILKEYKQHFPKMKNEAKQYDLAVANYTKSAIKTEAIKNSATAKTKNKRFK